MYERKETIGVSKTSQEIVEANFRRLVGRTLSMIEAAIPEKTQRESLKHLVEQEIYAIRNSIIAELQNNQN